MSTESGKNGSAKMIVSKGGQGEDIKVREEHKQRLPSLKCSEITDYKSHVRK